MGKFVDLTGKRFNRLTVIKREENYRDKRGCPYSRWMCKCDCGNTIIVRAGELNNGHTQSCGCLNRERIAQAATRHGLGKTRLYHIYLGMIDRCFDGQNSRQYNNYGGRGITVCKEWMGAEGAKRFKQWAMENGYSNDLSLDRINVNGNYEPSNCRWVTMKVQNNNKRDNHYITIGDETKTMKQWAEEVGLNYTTLRARIDHGWDEKEAIFTPLDARFSHKRTPNQSGN